MRAIYLGRCMCSGLQMQPTYMDIHTRYTCAVDDCMQRCWAGSGPADYPAWDFQTVTSDVDGQSVRM